MLHHDEAVAGVHQALEHAEELFDILAVQAGRRLIQQQQRAGFLPGGSEVAHQLEPLRLAAGKGV